MAVISELNRDEPHGSTAEREPDHSRAKDIDPNPRPSETAHYTNEGPVNPEIAKAAIAQVGINLLVTRRGEIHLR